MPIDQTTVEQSIDHLFRHHTGQMMSVLTRLFGLSRVDMIEDALQDALVTALQQWSFKGFPDNPRAWLIEVSKNRVLDRLRRDTKHGPTDEEIANASDLLAEIGVENPVYFSNELSEDQIRMIFACCHPQIPPDSQVALTLKIVSGFSISEIARAFLANEAAVAKMITRAKSRFRSGQIKLEIPVARRIPARLDSVLKVIYLMFNEGYSASEGEELIKTDLCLEAIRLCKFLTVHRLTATPKTHALAALLLFQGARLASRSDYRGELLLFEEQDRALWDKKMLSDGLRYFMLAASGDEVSDYHLEAEIASYYALAPDFSSIKWADILDCYDVLQKRNFSPVAELNRIIVLAKVYGPEIGLKALEREETAGELEQYNLFHITKAKLLTETNRMTEALSSYRTALTMTSNGPIRRFVDRRIEALNLL